MKRGYSFPNRDAWGPLFMTRDWGHSNITDSEGQRFLGNQHKDCGTMLREQTLAVSRPLCMSAGDPPGILKTTRNGLLQKQKRKRLQAGHHMIPALCTGIKLLAFFLRDHSCLWSIKCIPEKNLFHKRKRLLTKPAWLSHMLRFATMTAAQHFFLNPNPQTSTAAFTFVGLMRVYLCCWRSWACGVRSMQKAHTSPRGWLQPCAGDRSCRAAGSPEGIRYCSEVSPRRWQRCPRLSGKKACMPTTDRGSAWRAAAASLFGYRCNSGSLDLAPEYAKALQEHREITYKSDSRVTDSI